MAKARETIEISASPEDVWNLIGDPAGLAGWHPGVRSSDVENSTRIVVLGDGAELEEAITEHSDDTRSYSFEITESPLPVRDYSSRLSVEPSSGGSAVVWESEFEADGVSEDEAVELVSGVYRAGLDNVAQQLG